LEFCADRLIVAGMLTILSAILVSFRFLVASLWNWRCWLSDIRWPFSIGSGPADRGFVEATAYYGLGSTEPGRIA